MIAAMDPITTAIADHAAALGFERIPDAVVHAAKRHLVDTLACAIGGARCEAAEMGLALMAGAVPPRRAGRVLVHGVRSTAEAAAFINGAMIRYLDFNDTVHGGHPSDSLGALFALAEDAGADGKRLLSGMVVAYETATRLIAAMRMRERGWDQGFAIGIAACAGAGHLLRLPPERIAHAVAITAVANMPLRATRAGQLSKWKGAATAFAARNAVFACLLAELGMTGPEAAFTGRHGVFEQASGEFALPPFGDDFRTARVGLKYWPVENNAQAAVWAARALRERVDPERVRSAEIAACWAAWHELGSEPAKWRPTTRETADHSLPYIFARALADGEINVASFEEPAYRDPGLAPLMAKIAVRHDETLDKDYPDPVVMRVEAKDDAGMAHAIEIVNPRGHFRNPMDDAEISAKFLRMAEPLLGRAKADAALVALWQIEREANLERLFRLIDMK
jgi:2-methylcitrate dehydratase